MKIYNKLIRDQIPAIIEVSGKKADIEVLNDADYLRALNDKLQEELNEYNEEQDINELADLVEVIYAIVKQQGYSLEAFEQIRSKKKEERGGFEKKLLLRSVK